MKQGELFIFPPPDEFVALTVALYQLEKSGDYNDIDTSVFEVLLYGASCSKCLRVPKVSNLPLSCNSFCRNCYTNKRICDKHTGLHDTELRCAPMWNLCKIIQRMYKFRMQTVLQLIVNFRSRISIPKIWEANFVSF